MWKTPRSSADNRSCSTGVTAEGVARAGEAAPWGTLSFGKKRISLGRLRMWASSWPRPPPAHTVTPRYMPTSGQSGSKSRDTTAITATITYSGRILYRHSRSAWRWFRAESDPEHRGAGGGRAVRVGGRRRLGGRRNGLAGGFWAGRESDTEGRGRRLRLGRRTRRR